MSYLLKETLPGENIFKVHIFFERPFIMLVIIFLYNVALISLYSTVMNDGDLLIGEGAPLAFAVCSLRVLLFFVPSPSIHS